MPVLVLVHLISVLVMGLHAVQPSLCFWCLFLFYWIVQLLMDCHKELECVVLTAAVSFLLFIHPSISFLMVEEKRRLRYWFFPVGEHVPTLKVTGGLKKVEVSPINHIQHIPAFLWAEIGRCACQREEEEAEQKLTDKSSSDSYSSRNAVSPHALSYSHYTTFLFWCGKWIKKPGTCTNQNPVVRAWGERCKAVQCGEQEWARVIVFVYVSALGPRAALHSGPALLPKCGLTPSLVLALPLMPKCLYSSC